MLPCLGFELPIWLVLRSAGDPLDTTANDVDRRASLFGDEELTREFAASAGCGASVLKFADTEGLGRLAGTAWRAGSRSMILHFRDRHALEVPTFHLLVAAS